MKVIQIFCVYFVVLSSSLSSEYNLYDRDGNETLLISGGYRPKSHTVAKYIVSIRRPFYKYFGDNHFCGGAILSSTRILSAAHCVVADDGSTIPTKDIVVVAGLTTRLSPGDETQTIQVKEIIVHPAYVRTSLLLGNDVSILRLKTLIILDNVVKASLRIADRAPDDNAMCTLAGWGQIYKDGPFPDEILYTDVKLWSLSKCRELLARMFRFGILCAGGLADFDACPGDSGGPLICDNMIFGIVSFGFDGCGIPGVPGFYMDVWHFRDWIFSGTATDLNFNSLLFGYVMLFVFVANIMLPGRI